MPRRLLTLQLTDVGLVVACDSSTADACSRAKRWPWKPCQTRPGSRLERVHCGDLGGNGGVDGVATCTGSEVAGLRPPVLLLGPEPVRGPPVRNPPFRALMNLMNLIGLCRVDPTQRWRHFDSHDLPSDWVERAGLCDLLGFLGES